MNLVLLAPDDFIAPDRVRLTGRRLEHIRSVHRGAVGHELRIGVLNGNVGRGRIEAIGADAVELEISLEHDPPAALPLHLILALPRPKVLNRTIAAAASMGIRQIELINAWRVEKSYWDSPRISAENLRAQCVLGLEQGADTVLPTIRLHRLFTPFVRDDLPALIQHRPALVAHPEAHASAPRQVSGGVILAIGPEGGFIDKEIASFCDAGFMPVTLGRRILRVETALPYLAGRLF